MTENSKQVIVNIMVAVFTITFWFTLFWVNVEEEKVSTQTKIIPKEKLDAFMVNRLRDVNQTLMDSKVVNYNGVELYFYLSVTENGNACISTVAKTKFEVLAADCDDVYTKMEEWNALP